MKEVDYLRDPKTLLADPSGATCKAAPFHILGVDLAALPGKPLAKSKLKTQHLFESGCEDCDEWSCDYDYRPAGKKLARIAPKTAKKRCDGTGTTKPERKRNLALVPLAESSRDTCGRVGGAPLDPAPGGADLLRGTTSSFHCERCSVISQVLQCICIAPSGVGRAPWQCGSNSGSEGDPTVR